jgi:CheY-like chemotaxis protein
MIFNPLFNRRILVIDDDQMIQDLFRRILLKTRVLPEENKSPLFSEPSGNSQMPAFEVDSAYQGQDGLVLIEKSLQENRPYALAFVDVRMPPGWDGIKTTCQIWDKYCDLQVVICTAYSDYSWEKMVAPLGYLDRIVILQKPFENIEVLQLAVAMTEKWRLNQQTKLRVNNLEKLVQSLRSR